MEDDQGTVGRPADVQLEAVAGRDRQGRGERRQRVLGRVPPIAAMGQAECARRGLRPYPISSTVAIPRWSLG